MSSKCINQMNEFDIRISCNIPLAHIIWNEANNKQICYMCFSLCFILSMRSFYMYWLHCIGFVICLSQVSTSIFLSHISAKYINFTFNYIDRTTVCMLLVRKTPARSISFATFLFMKTLQQFPPLFCRNFKGSSDSFVLFCSFPSNQLNVKPLQIHRSIKLYARLEF